MSETSVPRISKIVRADNLLEDCLDVIRVIRPEWFEAREKHGDLIKSKTFTGGFMNKLIGFNLASNLQDVVNLKVYGSHTELLVDRQAEIDTMILLHKNKCGPQIYVLFDNGLSYEYFPGVTLTMETCRSPQVYPLVAEEMARLHNIPLTPGPGETKVKSGMWKAMQKFCELNVDILRTNTTLANRLLNVYGYTADRMRQDLKEIQLLLENEPIPVALCHNDLLLGNVIYNEEEKKISFIDFEYAMPNYVAFEVANHFIEMAGVENPDFSLCPDKEFRSQWVTEYLKFYGIKGFTQKQFETWVDICMPASHLFWASSAVVLAHHSSADFDFVSYAGLRYLEYKKHVENLRRSIIE